MLLGYASNFFCSPFPSLDQFSTLLCAPKGWPLWVASLNSCRQVGLANERQWREIKEGGKKVGGVVLPYSLSVLGYIFLAVAEFLQDCSSCHLTPPLWLQLSPWIPGMNAISSLCSFGPSSDNSFLLLLVSGWQEPHFTLNSAYSSENNPFIKDY